MVTELLTLRDLRVETLKERKEGRLTKIPNSFFNQIKNLENQIRNVIEQSKDNVKRLEKSNSDMRKLMDLKLELHKLRERKLTDLAREKVNGQNPKSENVHSNESEYLESICSVIEKHRESTLLSTDFEFIPEDKPDRSKEIKIEKKISGTEIKSPIIGTAYLAPEPGGKKFVDVGKKIKKGDTVMIVEAMKTMNHVPSTADGVVKEICVEDGQPVEFGQTIIILE